jgi:small subunit ribosomal protein S15
VSLTKQQKLKIISEYSVKKGDTGSPEVQVGLLLAQVTSLVKHLKSHRKDNHSRRGLLSMISKRRRLLNYLQEKDSGRYKKLVSKLK